jgi:outer membrane lipoprotein SlyB
VNDARAIPVYDTYQAPRRVTTLRATRTAPSRVVRSSGRDWTKTAMVIGGTTAAGAGLGAIFGGKKGALIGAAIGGGAGTLYEVKKR